MIQMYVYKDCLKLYFVYMTVILQICIATQLFLIFRFMSECSTLWKTLCLSVILNKQE